MARNKKTSIYSHNVKLNNLQKLRINLTKDYMCYFKYHWNKRFRTLVVMI